MLLKNVAEEFINKLIEEVSPVIILGDSINQNQTPTQGNTVLAQELHDLRLRHRGDLRGAALEELAVELLRLQHGDLGWV